MKFYHAMIRISDPQQSISFFKLLGLTEVKRMENSEGRFTLYFMAVPGNEDAAQIELTHNWDEKGYGQGRNFGHLAFWTDDIYEACERLAAGGVTINRPPRDGFMAFVQSPDSISIELVQTGEPLPPKEPWTSMPNKGAW